MPTRLRVLAFDTSTEWCTAALWLDGHLRTREHHALQRHSELLLPMVSDLLGEAGIKVADLDGIAFGAGPGSFTGLRIACAVAQGLALGGELPVIGVCTLAAMAWATGAGQVLSCLDARMGQVYLAAYTRGDTGLAEWLPPQLANPDEAPELPGDSDRWTGCGSGFAAYGDVLGGRYGARLNDIQPGGFPHARDIAVLGVAAFQAEQGRPAEEAVPLYLRDQVALTIAERRDAQAEQARTQESHS